MSVLDWFILMLFFEALIGSVCWVLKTKTDDTNDSCLTIHNKSWLTAGAALCAANISSEHPIFIKLYN